MRKSYMRKTYDRDTKLAYIEQIEGGLKTVPEVAAELSVSIAGYVVLKR